MTKDEIEKAFNTTKDILEQNQDLQEHLTMAAMALFAELQPRKSIVDSLSDIVSYGAAMFHLGMDHLKKNPGAM